jgi:CBS domain-containing protein
MTIGRLLATRDLPTVTCPADARVGEAAAILAERRIGALPVVAGDGEGGDVLGIFSERDLLYRIAAEGAAALDRPVREVMTAPALSVTSDTAVLAALSLMTRRRIRHLPVIDADGDGKDRMVGFVSIGDLVKVRIERIEAEAEAMREYIQTA